MSETPIHNLLAVKDTSKYPRIPLPTVYYLVHRGKIPAVQICGRRRINSLHRDVLRQGKQGQPTVLVVDDDPVPQDLFSNISQKSSASVKEPTRLALNVIVITGYLDGEIPSRILKV